MSDDTTLNLSADDKLNLILQRLTALEEKSYDTRPIWEQALKEIADTRLEMRERFEKLEAEMRQMNRRFTILTKDNIELRADVADLYQRLESEQPRQ